MLTLQALIIHDFEEPQVLAKILGAFVPSVRPPHEILKKRMGEEGGEPRPTLPKAKHSIASTERERERERESFYITIT